MSNDEAAAHDVLSVRALRKVFGPDHDRVVAVDDVSFSVPAAGSVALVGQSGSGKTTCSRIAAGLETATSGEILVCGRVQSRRAGRRVERRRRARQVQMVFQDPYASLDPRQTVFGALDEVLREHTADKPALRRDRVMHLLDQVGLPDRVARSRPGALSGGQRQRVAIARALSLSPQLLILDEAVAALDVSVQAGIINLLADLRERQQLAYLFVSHDLAVVRQISDYCVVMNGGRVVEQGVTDDVLDNPAHEFTRDLIDAVPRPGWRP